MQTRYLRALIAIGTISTVAGATFFVASRLSTDQSVAPNSPDSTPFAFKNSKTGVRLPDEDLRDIQRPTAPKSTPIVGRSDEKDYDPKEINQSPTNPPKPTSPKSPPDNQANYQTPPSTGGGSGVTNPSIAKTPTPNKPAPTPTFIPGTFGSQATEEQRKNPNSYMSDDKNKCDDGQGFISGTGCREDGTRFVLGLPPTQRAYQQALNNAQKEITNKTDEELIQLSGKNCPPTDNKCRNDAITEATNQLLKANAVVLNEDKKKITAIRSVNQATQDILFATDEQFQSKYVKYGIGTDRETVIDKILQELGFTKESLGVEVDTSKLVASREIIAKYSDPNIPLSTLRAEYCKTTNDPTCRDDFKREDILNNLQLPTDYKNSLIGAFKEEANKGQKITEQTLEYLSNKSDQQLAKEFCANSGNKLACERNFEREDLIATNPNPAEIIQIRKDQSLAQIYADPKNSTSDLAKIYCKGNRSCEENFTPDRFLSQITSPTTKQDAINNRNLALSLLIPQVVSGKPVSGIDVDTKKEIIKLNEDTTYAFWVYVRENSARQHKQNVTTEQLALEFNQLIKQNPTVLTENLKKYNENPRQYTMSFTTFKFDQEENPLIVAQYNQIIKNQPIKGLFENNKIVNWNQASDEYKAEARKLACAEDKSLGIYCIALNGYTSNSSTEEQKKNAIAQIDAAIAANNKQTAYLQQIFNSRTTDNLLSVNQSNLATIDNPALGDPTLQAEIKKANNAADVADIKNQMTYNTITYGNGMGMAPIIVPTTYKGNNTKLTEDEKAEIANEYLRRQLVVETYTRGAGVGGALLTAGAATALCAAYGGPLGVAAAPVCGAVGGLAGVASNIFPILGTATAEEIELERQKLAEFVGNDSAATFIQAMYSNQGAASDESWFGGRSQSALNNQYALLDRIHQTNYQTGATTNSLTDPSYQAQIAILPYQLQQGEFLQEANKEQQILNIASSIVVGGISGGVGGSLANKAATQLPNTLSSVFRSAGDDMLLWAGGALINDVQTQYQFDSTVNYLDTQTEISLEICNRTQGSNSAECRLLAQDVQIENQDARNSARQQAIVTDAIIQAGQTSTSFSASLYGYLSSPRPNTTTTTPTRPINPNDSTYISPELTQLLNLIDPRILNNNATGVDTITLSNIIKSQAIGEDSRSITLEQFKNQNLNTSVADESILQGVTLYKDLPDAQFTAKLKEIGFGEADIEIALKIRESGTDILYTNSINERIEQNETLAGQLRNNPRDQSENLNIKVDQEIMSDYNNFRKQQAEKFVADAKKALEAQNDEPTATAIDTKTEALKGFLAEASSPERLTPMNHTDIANLLTSLGYSPDDIQYVIDRSALPEVKTAIEKMLDFNNRSSQIRKEIVNIDPNIQEDINVRINSQKIDLLSNLAKSIPSAVPSNNSPIPTNNTSATANRAIFKPGDDIHQTMPNNEKNTIGKIPSKTIEIKGQQEQVYYRISYLENGKVTATEIHPLTDTNTLPTDQPFLLEFGIKKDPTQNISDNNFANINNSNINPDRGTQTLAMNISNEYTFGNQNTSTDTPNASPPTPQTPALTDAQRNQYATWYLNEKANLPNLGYDQALASLNEKYRKLGITISDNNLPNGFGPVRSAFVSILNRLFDPGTPNTSFNQNFISQTKNSTSPQAPNQPASTSLNDVVNQLANDTRVINRLVETTGGNYRVIYNDIVGGINTAESQIEVKIIEVTDLLKKNLLGNGETTVTPQVNPINQNISKAVDDYIKANFANMTKEETQKIVTATKKRITQIIENYQKSRKPKAPKPPKQTKNTPKVSVFGVLKFFGFTGTSSILTYIFSSDPKTSKVTPTPTPTAIYASPTPTTTPSPTPTQPSITPIVITPAAQQPKPFTPYTLPEVKSMTTNNMNEFALTAKAIGEMMVSCQSRGIFKDQELYDCLCEQTTNKCADNSTEKTIATSLAQSSGGQKPLECVEFLFEIERIRSNPIATGCEAPRANSMVPEECKGAGRIGAYYCPQDVVKKNGFIPGDVVVWQDADVGHTEVCTETNSSGCLMLGANANKDGRVEFRPISTSDGYAGVWRGGTNIEGCTEY